MSEPFSLNTKSMSGFPYFYHDLVARVIPGSILVFLLILLVPIQKFCVINYIVNVTMKNPVLFLTAFFPIILALGYAIGIIYEALAFLVKKYIPFPSKFKVVLEEYRHYLGYTPEVPPGDMNVYAWQAFRIFEAFEPSAPHFYQRGTRFLAESKMAFYSDISLIIAAPIAWYIHGMSWRFFLILTFIIILFLVGLARSRRFFVEVLACIEYLYITRKHQDMEAQEWIKNMWMSTVGYQEKKK